MNSKYCALQFAAKEA